MRLDIPGAALLLVLGAAQARAQSAASTGPQTQVWADFIAGRRHGERWYGELDVEPKWQLTGETWRALDLTPALECYPTGWLDLIGSAAVGKTRQSDGLDTLEATPRLGARFHLFAKMAPYRPDLAGLRERVPLTRLALATLVRLEWRNLFYSGDTPDKHQWRARLRVEAKLALNRPGLSRDRTLYAAADAEYFLPLGEDVPERYVNKVRTRLGLGFRFSARTRLELLYVRDWNRTAPGAEESEDTRAVEVRWKLMP